MTETPQQSSASHSPQPSVLAANVGASATWQQREKRMRLINIVLRCFALLLSFVSFVIMASNNHYLNNVKFNDFGEYSYCLSIAVIAFAYSALQLGKTIYEIITRKTYAFFYHMDLIYYIDFISDQILAYLLMSSSSAAMAITYTLRTTEGNVNVFTDMAAASASMAFLCFFFVAASSLLSGFHLSKRIITSLS